MRRAWLALWPRPRPLGRARCAGDRALAAAPVPPAVARGGLLLPQHTDTSSPMASKGATRTRAASWQRRGGRSRARSGVVMNARGLEAAICIEHVDRARPSDRVDQPHVPHAPARGHLRVREERPRPASLHHIHSAREVDVMERLAERKRRAETSNQQDCSARPVASIHGYPPSAVSPYPRWWTQHVLLP